MCKCIFKPYIERKEECDSVTINGMECCEKHTGNLCSTPKCNNSASCHCTSASSMGAGSPFYSCDRHCKCSAR